LKERLDRLLVAAGLYENAAQAQKAIMAGEVIINDHRVDKAGALIATDPAPRIRIREKKRPYVSRGGLKLEKALREFKLDCKGKIVLDIGASTGGFTDCALKAGAAFVYAVDVGTNQLDYRLRTDPRVKSMENTHIARLDPAELTRGAPDLITIDVSFISLRQIVDPVIALTKPETRVVALIKPQFEAKPEQLEKGGILAKIDTHRTILHDIIGIFREKGLYAAGLTQSPILGARGNREYLALFTGAKEQEIEVELDRALRPTPESGGKK